MLSRIFIIFDGLLLRSLARGPLGAGLLAAWVQIFIRLLFYLHSNTTTL